MSEQRKSVIETKGARATTLEETLKAADLNWEPREDQVMGATIGVVMPRKKMIYRSDNNQPLGVVGEDYFPSDPKEFLQSQYELAQQLHGNVVRAGWAGRRAKAFCCIRLVEDLKMQVGKRKVGDPVACYIYSTDGWDGTTARESKLYLERLRCTNGMTTRELPSSLWVPHTSGLVQRYNAKWDNFKSEVEKELTGVRQQFAQLVSERMTAEEMRQFVGKLVPGEGAASESRRKKISDLFAGGTATEGKTKWDAYNAVTEFVTHHATYRETKIASADTSRFLGVLGRNPLNERAMQLLLS